VRDEVLEDHLLDVAELAVQRGERLQRGDPLLLGLADSHQDPAGEWDPQLPGGADAGQPARWMLARGARVHRVHQPLGDRLQHQALRRGHLTQTGQVLPLEHTEIGVRQQPPLQRALARPDDVCGEVLVAVVAEPLGHVAVDLGMLAGQHQQLLDVAASGVVQHPLHLFGRVQMCPVRRERAVLAVAAART
jgi:hypothetical protein